MKRTESSPPRREEPTTTPLSPSTSQNHAADDWSQGDPVWDLLSEASDHEPGPFFARNVVRAVRLEEDKPRSLGSRLVHLFTSRAVTLGAAACACALIGFQFWPTSGTNTVDSNSASVVDTHSPADTNSEVSKNLSEILIEESLLAAADDPTMFTRDEVVTMLGL